MERGRLESWRQQEEEEEEEEEPAADEARSTPWSKAPFLIGVASLRQPSPLLLSPLFFNAEFFLLPPRKKGKGAFFVTSEF